MDELHLSDAIAVAAFTVMTPDTEQSDLTPVIIPSLIAVIGVLTVGVLQALVNRRVHLERLARDDAVTRRDAFTRFLATTQEGPRVKLDAQQAMEAWENVQAVLPGVRAEDPKAAQDLARQADDRLRAALIARQKWSDRCYAEQVAALGCVTDLKSPLLLTVKLPVAFEPGDEGFVIAMERFIEGLRVDAMTRPRVRRRKERELLKTLRAEYPYHVLFDQQTPEGPTDQPARSD